MKGGFVERVGDTGWTFLEFAPLVQGFFLKYDPNLGRGEMTNHQALDSGRPVSPLDAGA